MKLITDINLRRDGTVKVTAVPSGTKYEFKPDESGAVVCDVDSEADIAYLLDTGYFYPAAEEDIDAGLAAVKDDDREDGDTPPPPAEAPKIRARKAGK